MNQARLPAVFVRGGTSKAVLFKAGDLPADAATRDRIFCHVMGSPDPYGRQLDGLGGGISSLSKVVIVDRSARAVADIDYTFVQIAVDQPVADYGAMCGNMSSSVGPFAVDEGMVDVCGDEATVRVYNTNTDKLFAATFPVSDGKAVEAGTFEIPGVSGSGARVRLEYFDPAGAATGRLLPSGNARDTLAIDGLGDVEVSMVDASNPLVYVRAADLGKAADEAPAALEHDAELMDRLDRLRGAASVAMGMSSSAETALLSNPKVAIIGPPRPFIALDGRQYSEAAYHVAVRVVSMGRIHRAVPLTGAMCVAVAARIPGTVVHEAAVEDATTLIGNPSGLLPVQADVRAGTDGVEVVSVTTYRTQRRIMEGSVLLPPARGLARGQSARGQI